MGQNTLVGQVGLPLKFYPQHDYPKTQAHCVGEKLGLKLTPKKRKKCLLVGLVITLTSHAELFTYVSKMNFEHTILMEMLQ